MQGVNEEMPSDQSGAAPSLPSRLPAQAQVGDQPAGFDSESLVLRRSDPDDADAIINLVDIGEDDHYNRVYAYPKILKLIETAYLGITVIDRESAQVIAFAAFEDSPQGQRGMTDDRHCNHWEKWVQTATEKDDFSAFNTLWLNYFIVGPFYGGNETMLPIFRQVLHTVYTSLPDIIGVFFLERGDADEDDLERCFVPMSPIFTKLEINDRSAMSSVQGIHPDSDIHFSTRVHVIPYIEIRQAQQEDHDDLADVFNAQSETVTEAYGEYFIAELIAAQNADNHALVAQVKDKAIGLMGLTSEVDLKLLHRCFQLDAFDNLLKPDFMDAVRARRKLLLEKEKRIAENKVIATRRRFLEETMRCHVIFQRMELQEHLATRGDEIIKVIDELLANEDEAKERLSQDFVINELFDDWLGGFSLHQPSNYFLEGDVPQEENAELVYNVQSELEFMLSTLEIFGLPHDYVNGAGHHANWHRDKGLDDKKKAKSKKKVKKLTGAAAKLAMRGSSMQEQVEVRPTFFDLAPFQRALRKFLCCNPEQRSHIRCVFLEKASAVRQVFRDKYNELSFKKVVDVHEFSSKLAGAGITEIDGLVGESLGSLLICFGDIDVERHWGDRPPPETEDQKKARANLNFKLEERRKADEDFAKRKSKGQTSREEEEKKVAEDWEEDKRLSELQDRCKSKALIKVPLAETSIHDLLCAIQHIAAFDRILSEMRLTKARDWSTEDRLLERAHRPYVRQHVLLPEVPIQATYSSDPEIQAICEKMSSPDEIPEAPASALNAFAVTLFCMEAAFDCRSKDFLKYAFERFPDRDYLLVTQPHNVSESALLSKFTQAPKQSINTFQHVLYLIHRDYLFEQDLVVRRCLPTDLESVHALIKSSGDDSSTMPASQEVLDQLKEACQDETAAQNIAFTARVLDQVVGCFMLSRDVNLEYYISHFHVQDQLLLGEHARSGHSRLVYSIVNPIFARSSRWLLKEVLRLAGKTSLYLEVNQETVIPQLFHELVNVRARRFPHFLERKWDHEHASPMQERADDNDSGATGENVSSGNGLARGDKQLIDGAARNPVDEDEAPFALCFSTKRLLSEAKIVKNSRIVVVGASDTGISFIEALLAVSYLGFSNVTLVAPGGLPHAHLATRAANLRTCSTSYTWREMRKLMLESRVTVVDSRAVDIDRADKHVILNDGRVVPYDTLVLAMGIQDKTLSTLGAVSQGIEPVPEGARHMRGLLSIDDPYLYRFLASGGPLMSKLTDKRRQTNVVVYGRSLSTFTLIQGLLDRGVQPKCITLAVPRLHCHVNESDADVAVDEDMQWIYPNAFEDAALEQKITRSLEERGVSIIRECKIIEIISDRDHISIGGKSAQASQPELHSEGQSLSRIVLKRLDIPDEEEEEDEFEQDEKSHASDPQQQSDYAAAEDSAHLENEDASQAAEHHHEKRKKRKKNETEIECGVLVTCGHRDVDQDVFNAIHSNGLVYNGRLIVDQNFSTTDRSIFAAGPLCEFSNKFLSIAAGRSLRMDRYNGREMGARLARSVFDLYDPASRLNSGEEGLSEELPQFYLPQGQGGVLPQSLIYYHISTVNPLIFSAQQPTVFKNRPDLVSDNLNVDAGKGHFIKFSFNSIGLIDAVTYMGHEEVVLQSLWSLVGLHENYLNELTSRFQAGIIPNAVEFLSENWALALYHEWFGDFCLRMRQGIRGLDDVQDILKESFAQSKSGLGLSRDQLGRLQTALSKESVKMIQDETLEFLKTNLNHLPMYYIPGQEFS